MNRIVDCILQWGIEQPDKEALVMDQHVLTYGELSDNIKKAAWWFHQRGIGKGDTVVLASIVHPAYFSFYFGVHLLNAIAVPVEKNVTEERVRTISDMVKPKVVLVGEKLSETVDMTVIALAEQHYEFHEENSDELELVSDILFTTGTTGLSKGVMLTHGNIVAGAQNVVQGGAMKASDRNLLPVPLYHAYGLTTLRAILYCGATAVLQDGFRSMRKMHNNIHKKNCNCAFLVPSSIPVLEINTGNQLSMLLGGLEKIEFCTAPLEKNMRLDLLKKLPEVRIYNSYGATEAARTVYMQITDEPHHLGAIGKAAVNADIRIVDDQGREVSFGTIGRLCVSGEMVMKGYFDEDKLTKDVLHDKSFYTSDMGYMDEEGFIFLLGRSQDIMNIGGEKVAPSELEDIVYEMEFVKECACVSIQDPVGVRGEVPVVFCSPRLGKDIDVDRIKECFEKKLERFKRPYGIFSVEEIPKNALGKIDRNILRDMARSEYSDRDI